MKRSKFSLSNYKLLTCDMGELVPIGITEVLPGDTIQHHTSALLRVSPLNSPVMHPVHVRIQHYFVPHRLIWDDFEDFITGGPDGMDASVFPTIAMPAGTGAEVGSLADYLGVPTGVADLEVSALPFRAYAAIYNEWIRDQDLQTELVIDTTSGADTTTSTALKNVNWERDYFTKARPWTQKGDEVTLPLGTSAPVLGDNTVPTVDIGGTARQLYTGTGTTAVHTSGAAPGLDAPHKWVNTGMYANLSGATASTINELREAFALQRYAEARAMYGSRYTEYLRYLGVQSSDSRLQRPEYLGGGRETIQFSEVLQTGVTTSGNTAGPGNMKGHGISAMRSNRYRRYFEEHGYIVSVLSAQPKTMYAQGLPKTWNRRTKEDFFQRELQFIGQDEIKNKELYAAHATPEGTFGYSDRYDDYRRGISTIAGDFRATLDHWHMARIFASTPALNAAFVESNPTKRVNADTSSDNLWIMANHSIQARRMVSSSGAPGGI